MDKRSTFSLRRTLFPAGLLLSLLFSLQFAAQASAPRSSAGSNPVVNLPIVAKGFTGGPGTVTGTVRDASTGALLENVEVCYTLDCADTNSTGVYTLNNVPHGLRWLTATMIDYFDNTRGVLVIPGQTVVQNFVLSPELIAGQYQIVLTWNAEPPDLDAHLWTPDLIDGRPHVFQENQGNCDPPNPLTTACLDFDELNGFGPETITILEAQSGPYAYAVEKFEPSCGSPTNPQNCPTQLDASGAQVQVYDSTGLVASFSVPTTGNNGEFFWYVFDLDGDSGTITVKNCFTSRPSPIDSDPTCP